MLATEAIRWRTKGGGLYLSGLKKPARDLIRKGKYDRDIGKENMFPTKLKAVEAIFTRLDSGICRTCQNRIFDECESIPVEE